MTKVYKINGRRIESLWSDCSHKDLWMQLNDLLEALDEKKEEPKEECFYCDMRLPSKPDKERKMLNWHLNGHKEEPKSTLREDIKEILCEAMYLKPEYLDPTGNKDTDKIISLFKDTLLKEVQKAEPLRIPGESLEFTSGQEWTMRQIKQIIKNL